MGAPSRGRSIVFGAVVVVAFFGLAELALWLAGIPTLLSEQDPFQGFSRRVPVFRQDLERGVYFTPPRAVDHSFNYQEFRAQKADSGLRVFVLGGSSAYGFPWGAEQAFPRWLAEALAATVPGREVEVVNASAMSYGSHRLRILIHEVLAYDPDLVVVYGGHNELVERRFYRDHLERFDRLDPIRLVLSRSRLYSAGTRLYLGTRSRELSPESDATTSPGTLLGLDVAREHSTDVGPAERDEVATRFEENVRALVRAAEGAGVPVVLCTVGSNLREWQPNQSVFDPGLGAAGRREVESRLAEARERLDAGDATAAATLLESASSLAPEHAGTWFDLGRAYLALGRVEDAREAFVQARDHDARPTRAFSELNDAIRRIARETGALLVDAERALERRASDGIPGYDLYQDYVHPTPAAHREIALEVWSAILRSGWPEPGHDADPALFRASLSPAASEAPNPNAPALVFNLGVVLENQGRLDDAAARYRESRDLDPRFFVEATANLARILQLQGRHDDAAREYERVLHRRPDHLKSWIGLGETRRAQGRHEDALVALKRATEVDPRHAAAWNRAGVTLVELGRYAEAETAFRTALGLETGGADYAVDLGLSLLFQGRTDEARIEFERALEASPAERRAWNGIAAVYTEQGALDRAEAIFLESLELDPDDAFALGGLDVVRRRRSASP